MAGGGRTDLGGKEEGECWMREMERERNGGGRWDAGEKNGSEGEEGVRVRGVDG